MQKFFILILVTFLLAACASEVNPPTGSLTSGIKGQVLIGPSCPVAQVNTPCPDQPYQANITVLSLDGQEVTRFKTDAEGKFEIQLSPGDYILHPENPENLPMPIAADVPFTVIPNEFTNIIVTFDSGIR